MRHLGQPDLLNHVFAATIPMRGRMIHGRHPSDDLYEEPQDYDIHGRVRSFKHEDTLWCLPYETIMLTPAR